MKKQDRGKVKYHSIEDDRLPIIADSDHAARLLCFDPMIGDYIWLTAAEWLENRHMAWNGIVTGNMQNILILADAFDLIPHKKRRKKR